MPNHFMSARCPQGVGDFEKRQVTRKTDEDFGRRGAQNFMLDVDTWLGWLLDQCPSHCVKQSSRRPLIYLHSQGNRVAHELQRR